MKRIIILLISVFLLISGVSCTGEDENFNKYEASKTDYSAELDINSPEGLAKASGLLYKMLSKNKISTDDAVEKLKEYACKESLEGIKTSENEFKKGIKDFMDYMKSTNDEIEKIEYAETVFEGVDKAYIERIQKHKKGKSYYFRQDFVLEDDQWKISGDNITDPFKIKVRFNMFN